MYYKMKCKMWPGKGYLGRNSAGTYSAYKDAYITHIRHPKLPPREITETKNPREHKNKHMQ
jgi:hypothetical protein